MPRENASDHDLLIRLDTKVDQLTKDVKSMGDGVTLRVSNIEMRINDLEKLRDEIQPETLAVVVRDNAEWIKGFKNTWKLLLAVFSTISLIVGAILGSFNLFDHFLK